MIYVSEHEFPLIYAVCLQDVSIPKFMLFSIQNPQESWRLRSLW